MNDQPESESFINRWGCLERREDPALKAHKKSMQEGFNYAVVQAIQHLSEAGMQDAISVLQKEFRTDYDPKNEEATHFHLGEMKS